MEKIFLQTKNGRVPIDPEIARKYGLKKGMTSPFSKEPIVDENGNGAAGNRFHPASENKENGEGMINDELVQLDNGVTLFTSEMIDIAQGADSDVEGG